MSPLDRKLWRDLAAMKGQMIAIALVIAVGVLLQVMMSGLVSSLTETRRAYYERNRMADVFAPLVRAPNEQLQQLAALDGVSRVEGRLKGSALIDVPGEAVPVQAEAHSLPDRGLPAMNVVYLSEGQMPAPTSRDEILLLAGFGEARGYALGDRLEVTMRGVRRSLKIVGFAQAPDLLYTAVPGEMMPDERRFGVIWMRRSALAAAFDLEGAFNEALIKLSRNASAPAVIDEIDRVLDPWGGRGAFVRADLMSDRFVSEEINGLRTMSAAVPPIFLGVAAFLLYIVISRVVTAEREEIGLLKAFGYTDGEVGAHYFKMIFVVALGGALAGCVMGVVSGRAMINVYTQFYHFPFLVFRPDPAAFVIGVSASVLAASAGGFFVLRRVFALTPAEAMRPATPPDFSRTRAMPGRLKALLDQPTRMVIRGLIRQPWRAAALIAGLAAGMALSAGMTTIYRAFEDMMDKTFTVIDRSDATVSFNYPVSSKAALEIARMPGVLAVEPARDVAVVFRNGRYSYRGAINGMIPGPNLSRAIDADDAPIDLPSEGIVLSQSLADTLHIKPGDTLTVEVRQGRQPVLSLPVARIAQSLIGTPAYMDIDALGRAMTDPGRITSVHLRVDAARADAIYGALKNMPTVAGVSVSRDARDALKRLMDQGAGSSRYVMGVIAFVIASGIVYNAARIAQSERARDLASLRVMGFTTGEAGFVLLGELGVILLIALPIGSALGHGLAIAIANGFSTDIYQISARFDPFSHGFAALFILSAALFSGWLVQRDLNRSDLVLALKTRE